jgi:hypothetical protein
MRWEEPHHPGPLGFNSIDNLAHFLPLCNTVRTERPKRKIVCIG